MTNPRVTGSFVLVAVVLGALLAAVAVSAQTTTSTTAPGSGGAGPSEPPSRVVCARMDRAVARTFDAGLVLAFALSVAVVFSSPWLLRNYWLGTKPGARAVVTGSVVAVLGLLALWVNPIWFPGYGLFSLGVEPRYTACASISFQGQGLAWGLLQGKGAATTQPIAMLLLVLGAVVAGVLLAWALGHLKASRRSS